MAPHSSSDTASTAFRSGLIGFDEIRPLAIEGWEDYLHQGEQYLTTARRAFAKGRQVFTAEILYNLISMAIEKLVMAALMRSGNLPYNHTMRDLTAAMEEHFPGRLGDLRDRLLALDAFQEICDLDTYRRTPPAMAEIPAMLELADKLEMVVGAVDKQ